MIVLSLQGSRTHLVVGGPSILLQWVKPQGIPPATILQAVIQMGRDGDVKALQQPRGSIFPIGMDFLGVLT
jgi:hypothetical protein